MIRLGVLGAKGRMGQTVCRLIARDYSGVASVEVESDSGSDLKELLKVDAIIDFSLPEGLRDLAKIEDSLPPIASGTTGWSSSDETMLDEISTRTRVLLAPNFSIGVNVFLSLANQASKLLHDKGYEASILDVHHIHKKDAPSGTGLAIHKSVEPGFQNTPIESKREGEVVGLHTLTFESAGDTLSLTHDAKSREIFAKGAIEAALWLAKGAGTGRLSMKDFLGI
jgi:4-hydroxy-tetrahydrodipicolinate reductase